MRISLRADEVRQLVGRVFEELSDDDQLVADMAETILIDRGKFRGRSYRVRGLMAMWLSEVGIIQFYDADGSMLRTINLFEDLRPLRLAA